MSDKFEIGDVVQVVGYCCNPSLMNEIFAVREVESPWKTIKQGKWFNCADCGAIFKFLFLEEARIFDRPHDAWYPTRWLRKLDKLEDELDIVEPVTVEQKIVRQLEEELAK